MRSHAWRVWLPDRDDDSNCPVAEMPVFMQRAMSGRALLFMYGKL